MVPRSRYAQPVLLRDDGLVTPLQRVTFGHGIEDIDYREDLVQKLVHCHPELIPMAEIEPAFDPLVPICRELKTPSGDLDNFWLTPQGGIVLGECKLVKNPQARREVVTQALDYARAIAGWHYEDLEAGVRTALKSPTATIWPLIAEHTSLDEAQFVDAVERRLRFGRFLILIIGDGIQEGAETLVNALQLHAGLHVGLALVELSFWKTPSNETLVIPRVPLRTVIVERGIVVVDPSGGMRIEPPSTQTFPSPRPTTLSEAEFYEQIELQRPGVSALLRSFLDSVAELGVVPEFKKTLVLRWRPSAELEASAGYIETAGRAWFADAWGIANKLGKRAAGDAYLNALANAVGGRVKCYKTNSPPSVVGADGKLPDITALLRASDTWKAALADLIAATRPSND